MAQIDSIQREPSAIASSPAVNHGRPGDRSSREYRSVFRTIRISIIAVLGTSARRRKLLPERARSAAARCHCPTAAASAGALVNVQGFVSARRKGFVLLKISWTTLTYLVRCLCILFACVLHAQVWHIRFSQLRSSRQFHLF